MGQEGGKTEEKGGGRWLLGKRLGGEENGTKG